MKNMMKAKRSDKTIFTIKKTRTSANYLAFADKKPLKLVGSLLLILLCMAGQKSYGTTYYNNSTGQLNAAASWGTNTDGSGTIATSFTHAGDIFNLNNNPATQTFTTAWVLGATTGTGLGGVTLSVNKNITMAASNSGIVINGTVGNPGSLVIAAGDTLSMNTGSANTITMSAANASVTDNGALKTGCTATTPVPAVSYAGAVIYNGTALQKPTVSSGTLYTMLVIDNACSITTAFTFVSGTSLALESGQLSATASIITMNTGSHLLLDQGTLSAAPTFANFNPTDITYTNLGTNYSGTINTSVKEWPTAYAGNIIINYPGVSYSLPAGTKTPSNLTVTAGTLNAANTSISLSGGNFANSGTTTFTSATLTTNNFSNSGTVSFTSGNLNVAGSWVNNGTFTAGTGTVTFNSSGAQTIAGTLSGTSSFYDLTFNGTGSWSFTSNPNVKVSDNLTITAGTVTATSDTLTINNNYSNSGTFNNNGGTVLFTSSTITNTISGTLNGASAFYNLAFNGTGTWSFPSANNVAANNNFTVISGTVDPTTDTFTINGSFNNSGTVKETTGTLVVSGNFVNNGTFKETTGGVNMNGNFTNNGTFTEGTGTVTFDGTSAQTINGTITFYNMAISNNAGVSAATAANVTVSGAMQFIAGNYIIGAGNTLTLSGSAAGMGATTAFTGGTTSNLTITGTSSSFTIFMDQAIPGSTNGVGTLTLSHPAGTVTLGLGSPLYIATNVTFTNAGVFADGGNTIKVEGSWINNHNTGFSSTGTVIFDGTGAQTLGGSDATTFTNLTNNNTSGLLSVTHNTFVTGTLTINASATLNPSPAVNFNNLSPQGTITGTGTIYATIPGAFISQYRFATYNLGNLTTNFNSSLAQTVNNPSAYGTLLMTNGGTKTAQGNITVNNVLNVAAGTVLDMANYTLNSGGATSYTVNGTLRTGVADTTSTVPLPAEITWNGTGTIEYEDTAGGQTVVAGIYNNLQFDDTTNSDTAGGAITVNGQLTLGNLALGANNLNLTTSANITGASARNYIITNGAGQVIQQLNANGIYTYPVGDAVSYSPITLNVTGSSYASANIAVGVKPNEPSQNANTTNYINRYWSVSPSGISGLSYAAAATFTNSDVVGIAGDISMGSYSGALPWTIYGAESGDVLTSGSIAFTGTMIFTGINNAAGPVAVSSVNTAICNGGNTTLSGSASTGDAPLSYSWAPVTGLSSTGLVSVIATPTTTTTYTLTVTDGNGFTNATTTTVSVNATPSITSYTLTPSLQNICEGSAINLGVSITGGAGSPTFTWSGPGITTTNTTSVPSLTYVANATGAAPYEVTVAYSGSGCAASAPFATTLTYSVNALPAILTATVTPGGACVNNPINLMATSTGGYDVTYLWTGGTSAIANNTSINGLAGISSIQLTDATAYTVTASAAGCGSTTAITGILAINSLPTTFTASVNPNPVCVNGAINLSATSAGGVDVSYVWTGGTSTIINNNSINGTAGVTSVQLTDATTYTVTASAPGCGSLTAVTGLLVVNALPTTLTASVNPSPVCRNGAMNLSATSVGGVGVNYVWTGGTSTITNNTSISGTAGINSVQLTDATTYTLTASSAGCGSSMAATGLLSVDTVAVMPTNSGYACFGGTEYLYAGETGTAPSVTYSWSGPNGFTAATGNASLTGVSSANTGIYTLTATSSLSGCVATGSTAVVIDTLAVAPNNSGYACNSGTVTLDANSYSTTPSLTYSWIGPNGYTSTSTNPTISNAITAQTGIYTITISSPGSGCTVSGVTSVTIDTFNVIASNTGPACAGASLSLASTLIGTVSPASYAWTGPLGFSSSLANTLVTNTATPGMAGIYTLSISASGSGCSVTKTTNVTVNPNPASIMGNLILCAGLTQALSDITGGGSWSSSNTANLTVGSTGIITGLSAGTASVYYTLATGCNASTTATIDPYPTALSGTYTVCVGSITTLSDGAIGGSWSSSNSNVSVDGSGHVLGLVAGTSVITYSFPGGCQSTTTVSVSPAPGSILGVNDVCAGLTSSLSDATAGGTWSSGNTAIATVNSTGTVTGLATGTASIFYTTTSTGCASNLVFTVNTLPSISGNLSVCSGTTSALSDASSGGIWSMGSLIATINGSTGVVTASASYTGTATITYTAGSGCTAITILTVSSNPTAIQGITSECPGNIIILSDAAPGGTWSGTGDATVSGIGTAGTLTAGAVGGSATVSYTLPTGCYVIMTSTIKPNPTAILGVATVCVGSVTILSDATSGVVSWSSSNSAIASAAGGDISGITPGTATITYTINTGCFTTTAVSVISQPSITGDISAICPGSTIALTDGASTGTWTSSSTITSVGSTGIVTGISGGTSTITFVPLSGAGCSATAVVTVSTVSAITGPGVVCTGTTISLSDATAGGVWSSNATAVATIGSSTGTVTGVAVGSAAITYTIGAGCSVSTTISVNAGPTALGGAASVCAGSVMTLTDGVAGGTWSSSNSAIGSVDGSGDVSGVSAGTVNITYATSSCSVSRNVTINALPGTINGPSSICIGAPATLTDATTGGAWSITGSAASVGSTGIVTGASAGTGTVSYILTSTGCGTSKLITVTTSAGNINGNAAICTGSNITLTDAGTGTWTSSNVSVASVGSSTGVLTGVSAGTATISFITGSCFATAVATVNGAVGPIHGATSVCQGATLSLSDATTGGIWSSGNTAIATAGSAGLITALITTVTVPASVTITYSAGIGCSATLTVTANPAPGPINGNLGLCPGSTSTLSDALTAGTWSMSSLYASVVGSTGVVTGSATYTGTATISYTAAGCSVTGVVSVNPKPTTIQGATTICAGNSTALSDASQGGTWSGSGDATITGIGSVGTFVALGTGAGTATTTYTLSTGCYATFANTVLALPQPIMGNFNMCVGLVTILSDASPVSSWTSSNTAIAIASGADISGVSAGTAIISFKTSSSGNCVVTQVVTVSAMPVVTAINGPATISHAGSPVSISDATAGGIWTSSNTSVITLAGSTGSPINATALTTTGSSTISYAVTISGCKTTVTKTFSASADVHPLSTLTVYTGAFVSLADEETGGSWNTSDNTIATVDDNGIVTGIMPGSATITHVATPNGVETTTTTVVIVTPIPMNITLLPNPNKGTFILKGTTGDQNEMQIEVTDVLGHVIYNNKLIAQDRKLDETISLGRALPNGIYLLNAQTGTAHTTMHFVVEQ